MLHWDQYRQVGFWEVILDVLRFEQAPKFLFRLNCCQDNFAEVQVLGRDLLRQSMAWLMVRLPGCLCVLFVSAF